MSTDYSKMSDFEINLRVAEIVVDYDCISRLPYTGMAVHWGDGANWHVFNPCNNPADAWPIIVKNRISIDFDSDGSGELREEWVTASNQYFSGYLTCEKALRAAMIVFLKMQESKNAS